MERGARDVVLVGKDARESFSGKSGHVQALSDVVNLLERSSLEESQFLGHHCFFPYLFLSFSLSPFFAPLSFGRLIFPVYRQLLIGSFIGNFSWIPVTRFGEGERVKRS